MEKIKIAIVGYGNVGKGVHKSIGNNPDTELVGIITRDPERVKKEVQNVKVDSLANILTRWGPKIPIDVAILCGGSKNDLPNQGPFIAQYFNTVDSFDTHANISDYFSEMDKVAKKNNHTSVISAGWDPGTFSLERILADAFIPGANHYTFWGPGVSQGHSDALRQVRGVKDAIQYTMPTEEAIESVRKGNNPKLTTREKHWRNCYVVLNEGADKEKVEQEVKAMPNYFADYDTEVTFVSQEKMDEMKSKMYHKGSVITTGKTGENNKALIEYKCKWASNPEATGSILVANSRAVYRLSKERKTGAFTMPDIPPSYFSPHSREKLLKEFM